MRSGNPDIRSKADLDRATHGGRPVLVELYSNFCLICMAYRQVLVQAAAQLGESCRVARVELPTAGGREIADAHHVLYTPSFLLFDEHGDLVRTIVPDTVTPLANGYRVLDEQGQLMTRLTRIAPADLVRMVRAAP
jgi:thiol-disulfide isomerase/thioredoxin